VSREECEGGEGFSGQRFWQAQNQKMQFDDAEPYALNLWIESNKTIEEFESSLSKIIAPLVITNHQFALGEIIATINHNLVGLCTMRK
jgi:hypothetical protein